MLFARPGGGHFLVNHRFASLFGNQRGVLGEAGSTDVEVGAGELVTISDVRDGVLSISASSLKPEGTSVSSSGLDMSVQSRSLSI